MYYVYKLLEAKGLRLMWPSQLVQGVSEIGIVRQSVRESIGKEAQT